MSFTENLGNNIGCDNLLEQIAKYIGTTVTIYTASGGQSGCGFTGVLTLVDPRFVRLITCIGPAPCCCLGSACTGGRIGRNNGNGFCGGFGGAIHNVGSVADIPVDRIAAFVHHAV